MTEPTPDQIQRACDLANGSGNGIWTALDYADSRAFTALADTIAKLDAMADTLLAVSAELIATRMEKAAMQAERDKARADLGEIDALLEGQPPINSSLTDAQAIAAPYRVETDPLEYAIGDLVEKPKGYPFPGKVVSAFAVTGGQRFVVESELSPGMLHIFSASQLAKRGLEIGRSA